MRKHESKEEISEKGKTSHLTESEESANEFNTIISEPLRSSNPKQIKVEYNEKQGIEMPYEEDEETRRKESPNHLQSLENNDEETFNFKSEEDRYHEQLKEYEEELKSAYKLWDEIINEGYPASSNVKNNEISNIKEETSIVEKEEESIQAELTEVSLLTIKDNVKKKEEKVQNFNEQQRENGKIQEVDEIYTGERKETQSIPQGVDKNIMIDRNKPKEITIVMKKKQMEKSKRKKKRI
jgi:hypothetical protein